MHEGCGHHHHTEFVKNPDSLHYKTFTGPDGACEMALEDLAMFRAIPGCTVFYPSDAVSCERAVELAANQKGICYIRTTRPTMSTIYPNEEIFRIGEAKVRNHSLKNLTKSQ